MYWSIQKRFLFVIFILLRILGILPGQDLPFYSEPRFERYSVEQGLHSNEILCMTQDQTGYIWVGGVGGLYRFDGNEFYHFPSEDEDIRSLQAGIISYIYEDSDEKLWIGSLHNGLKYLDRISGEFTHYRVDTSNHHSISSNSVIRMLEDPQGNFWVGTERGLNLMDRKTGQFTLFEPEDSIRSRTNFHIMSMDLASDGMIWIGTLNQGLFTFDPKTRIFQKYWLPFEKKGTLTLSSIRIRKTLEDSRGNIWVGSTAGLFRFDRRSREVATYQKTEDPRSLAGSSIMDLLEDPDGRIWIATQTGLSVFDTGTSNFANYYRDDDNANSLSNDYVDNIFQDRQGNIWAGTSGGGVCRLALDAGIFRFYGHNHKFTGNSSIRPIQSVTSDRDGMVWIGGIEGSFSRFNPKTHQLENIELDFPATELTFTREIRTLLADHHNNIWIGTRGMGLFQYQPPVGTLLDMSSRVPSSFDLEGKIIAGLYQDSKNRIWIGTSGRGLILYDPETNSFQQFLPSRTDPHSISTRYPYYFMEDHLGGIWIGMNRQGLDRYDPLTGKFEHFKHSPEIKSSVNSSTVNVIFRDSRDSLWVGTDKGLNLFRFTDRSFKNYQSPQGFMTGDVAAIEEDNEGFLWIGTDRGLFRFDPKTEHFQKYDHSDGLAEHNFLWDRSTKDSGTGQLIFGTKGGMLVFQPQNFRLNTFIPPVVISKATFYFNGPENRSFEDIWIANQPTTTLSNAFNVIELDLASLNYKNASRNQYAYRLERISGLFPAQQDQPWFNLSTQPKLRFINLRAGAYILQAKGSNNDGIWNSEGTRFNFTILPPWWETWWAYTIYVLIGLAFLYWIRRIEMNRRHLRQQAEIAKARAEEKQLHADQIEAQARRLEQTNEELIKKNEEILVAQNQLIEQEKLASLGQLTAGIAHEIKNPLNFVNNFAEGSLELLEELSAEIQKLGSELSGKNFSNVSELLNELLQNSEDIRSNGMRADRIIHSMMDHARGTNNEKQEVDLKLLLDDAINLAYHGFRSLNPSFNGHIEKNYDPKADMVFASQQELGRVFLNLLNNACFAVSQKQQKSGAHYRPLVTVKTIRKDHQVLIIIQDNGEGIDEEARKKIFQPFFTTKPTGAGNTGLGLYICYDIIVNHHHGQITVESEKGNYTRFTVILSK